MLRRSAPRQRVDRLVVVADDARGCGASRRAPGPTGTAAGSCPGTRRRGGSASAPGTWRATSGASLEQPDGLEQQVVEVERVGRPQALLVARREAGDRPLAVVDGVLGEERRVEHLVLGPADRAEHRARPELAGQRQVLLAQDLLHQRLLVVGVVDRRTGGRSRSPRRRAAARGRRASGTCRPATSRPRSPTRLMIRSRSSPAARFVNVTARIRHGRTSLTPTGTRSGGRGRASCPSRRRRGSAAGPRSS